MFRRMRRAAFQPNPLGPLQMQALNRANQLLAAGQPGQAAQILAGLAGELEGNHPRRAANVHAQAAHAFADSQNEQAALTHARVALNLFIQYQMIQRTPVFYSNITRKFTNKGMKGAADALAREFSSKVGPIPAPSAAPSPQALGRLPTNCTKCGAPIHKDDVNWVDNQTAECEYCGSLIRPE